MNELIYREECYKIKQACIEVRKRLGNGFLEKVYERALVIELQLTELFVETQKHIQISYRGEIIADYKADLVVNDKIIIELNCEDNIKRYHKAQLLNYLKATGFKLGIIVNFPNNRSGYDFERIPNLINKVERIENPH